WSSGKTVYQGASAYSSLTVLNNGNIGLFFEKDGYQKNVFVQFSLQWLTNNLDELKNPE
ncbi:MAG: exo-alpha-sialidase, partial [Pricia sp.]|nr:exo-alpha-sialidase [Pricia sp.]